MSYNVGMATYGNEQKETVEFNGTLTMDQTTVTGHTKVMGMLTCNNAKLNTVDANGTVKAVSTVFNGNVSVKGLLEAIDSVFHSHVTVQSKSASFTDTNTKSITIQPNPDTQEQVVHLNGHTNVDGNITFENGNGKVNVAPSASITGEIVGGVRSNL